MCPPAAVFRSVGAYPVFTLRGLKKVDLLCSDIGRSDLNLLFACGRGALGGLSAPGVAGMLDGVGVPFLGGAVVLGAEVWCGTVSDGALDGARDDSMLFRGKGNSSAGGIGRMLVPASMSSEVEEDASIMGL